MIKPHLGPVHLYGLCPDEEQQWRRWSPKTDDVVLVDLPEHGVWPGKVSFQLGYDSDLSDS